MARKNAKSRGIFASKRPKVEAHSLQPVRKSRLARRPDFAWNGVSFWWLENMKAEECASNRQTRY